MESTQLFSTKCTFFHFFRPRDGILGIFSPWEAWDRDSVVQMTTLSPNLFAECIFTSEYKHPSRQEWTLQAECMMILERRCQRHIHDHEQHFCE